MSKTKLLSAITAVATASMLALPSRAAADAGHDEPHQHGSGAPHVHGTDASPDDLRSAWRAAIEARNAIAGALDRDLMQAVHGEAEQLAAVVAGLDAHAPPLEAAKRARVQGAAKQVARVADALHDAADRGDAARARKELVRIDALFTLIEAQYPAGALPEVARAAAEPRSGAAHDHAAHDHDDAGGAHAHAERAAGEVDDAPRGTVRVRVVGELRFEPAHLELRAGVPTRVELYNTGAAEHALVVRTPDGTQDWIHLHAPSGETAAATYRLDAPGTYPVQCTIPGHTEAGMVGDLTVLGAADR
jgi:plastocyanin